MILRTFSRIVISAGNILRNFGNYILQPVILLLFRIYWGWQFFLTGKGKLINHERTVGFFTDLGIPMPELNAWFVGGVECVGGLLLIAGLFSRYTGCVLSINMLVAYLTVTEDREALFDIFTDPTNFIAADPFFFLVTSLLVWAFGSGRLSADRLLKFLKLTPAIPSDDKN